MNLGTSLAVRWLRLQCRGPRFNLWLENYIPHAATKSFKPEQKIPHAALKSKDAMCNN